MKLTAACAFGLEAIVKRELIALGYEPKIEQPGRISFQGDWSAVAQTNLWLRTADRILIEVLQFDSPDFDALFDTVKDYDWSTLIPVDAIFPVTGRSRLSQLTSVPAVQRTVKRAVVESLLREHDTHELPEHGALYKIDVALLKDVATITLDTTGASLHKRGYRTMAGQAPLKETMAAALVDLSVWNPERVLVDPFCGTGTIPIEAALIGLRIPPGIHREFSFEKWEVQLDSTLDSQSEIGPAKAIELARSSANSHRKTDIKLQLTGTDIDPQALDMARYHAKQAGVAEHIQFQQKSFADFRSKREYGCMVTNPPYGERLEDTERLLPLYQSIPMVFQQVPTWSLFLITNMPRFESIVQKKATRRRKLFNGRIECTYYQFLGPRPPRKSEQANQLPVEETGKSVEPKNSPTVSVAEHTLTQQKDTIEKPVDESAIAPSQDSPSVEIDRRHPEVSETPATDAPRKKKAVPPVFGGLHELDHHQAELFKSRLAKRARHLRRWPTRRNINCFRLYERDVPEIPLVVDRYGDALHITRYDRPHDRDLARDDAWLELMRKTAAETLEIPIKHAYIKHREQDLQQYSKVDSQKNFREVQEGDLKFLVNLTDYVDTGLFLDHRNLRGMVREQAAGKDFLNLFAYTGSFSVYAAAGGAKSTTTVDLSKRYLKWATRNLEINNLAGPDHHMVDSDSIEFLKTAMKDMTKRYDLAVVDPPTYSNSKRTEEDWDVQKRHVELLRLVRRVIRPGGLIYFSSNFRRFKLDEAGLVGFSIREISKQTVPEDFRNKRIHRCWQLSILD